MPIYANISFYVTLQTLAGLFFGAAEYSFMLGHFTRPDTVFLPLFSLLVLLVLYTRKSRLTRRHETLFALARPYRHITADYMYSISSLGSFSLIVYIYSQNITILDSTGSFPWQVLILFANF